MDMQRNLDGLNREPELIERALTKVTIVLALIACAVYAAPAGAGELKVMTTGLGSGHAVSLHKTLHAREQRETQPGHHAFVPNKRSAV